MTNTHTCTSFLFTIENPLGFLSDPGTNQSVMTVTIRIVVAACVLNSVSSLVMAINYLIGTSDLIWVFPCTF